MRRLFCLAALILIFTSAVAKAATTCTVSANGVIFGVWPGTTQRVTGTISVTCRSGPALTYTINLSAGAAANYSPRRMSSGANKLSYNLYADAAYSQIWGDGTGGTVIVPGSMGAPGPGTTNNHTVYGQIPSQTLPPAGSYTDTITVTVTY